MSYKREKLEKIKNERTEQIKSSALKLFARNGYSGTKTSTIASETGISEGLIYRYYRSKEELFTSLIKELLEEAMREIKYLDCLVGSPYEQIKMLTQNMLDENNRYAFMLIERARKDEDIPEKVNELLKNYSSDTFISFLVPIFQKGQELGEISHEDPHKLASWYFFIINSICMQDEKKEKFGMPSIDILMKMLKK